MSLNFNRNKNRDYFMSTYVLLYNQSNYVLGIRICFNKQIHFILKILVGVFVGIRIRVLNSPAAA